jgi:hypothetical protein
MLEFSPEGRGAARAAGAGAGAAARGEGEVGVAAPPGAEVGRRCRAGHRGGSAWQVYGVFAGDGLDGCGGLWHGPVLAACVPSRRGRSALRAPRRPRPGNGRDSASNRLVLPLPFGPYSTLIRAAGRQVSAA